MVLVLLPDFAGDERGNLSGESVDGIHADEGGKLELAYPCVRQLVLECVVDALGKQPAAFGTGDPLPLLCLALGLLGGAAGDGGLALLFA